MKAYTKLLSILLVIAMCFSFAVITASADGDIPDEAQSEENQKQDSPAEEKSSDEEKSDGSQSADLIVNGAVVSASDSASGSYSKAKTEQFEFKEGQTWRASQDLAILFDHSLTTTESTAAGNATFGKAVAGQDITVKFYYTREIGSASFLDEPGNLSTSSRKRYLIA